MFDKGAVNYSTSKTMATLISFNCYFSFGTNIHPIQNYKTSICYRILTIFIKTLI